MTKPKPTIYVGQSQVAAWLGVSTQAVSNWINGRHTDTFPQPDSVTVAADGGETLGWLPERRSDWTGWDKERKAANAHKPRKPRTGRYVTQTERETWQ